MRPIGTHDLADSRFRTLADNIPDPIVAVDRGGRVVYLNAGAERVFGYSASELVGERFSTLLPERHIAAHSAAFEQLVAARGKATSIEAIELTGRRRDDTELPLELSLVCHESAGQVHVTALIRDVSERVAAEERLLKLESELAEVQALAKLGSWEWDPSTDTVTWSDEMFRIFDLERSAFTPTAESLFAFYHPDDIELARSVQAQAIRDPTPFQVHHRIVTPAGEVRTLQTRGKPITADSGHVSRVIGTTQDVTEQLRSSEQRELAEQRFRLAFDDASVGMALTTPDGLFVQVNRAFCEILGCSPADLIGKCFLEITHPDDRRPSVEGLGKLLRGEQPLHRLEKRYRHADGHWVDARLSASAARDARGEPILVIAQVEDLSERRRAERALSDSHERLQAVLDNSPLAIYMKDLEGRYVLANRQAGSMVELDEQDFFGKTDHELFPAELADRLIAADRRVADSGEPLALEEEVRIGERVLTAFSQKFPVRDSRGGVYAIGGISMDITGRVEAERDKRRLEGELEQARRMEGIGRLAGGIAHDFNNLLSVILSYASLVRDELPDADPVGRDLEEIQRAGERAAELTQRLLVFSRHERVDPRALDLNAVVREAERLLGRTLGEDIELRVELEQDLPSVEADRGQIERALLNLVANARDAMPQGGTLSIRTAEIVLAGERLPEGAAPGGYVRLTVSDTGAGMAADVAARAFEPFFTTKPPGEGAGFGLATVYGVVHQAGGSVELASRPGEGTAVSVYLPVTEQLDRTEPAQPEPQTVTGAGQSVLVVEDDPSVRRMVCRILADGGYSVEEVSTPWDALEACASADKRVDLLVTDVVMPSLSGGELVERARSLRPDLSVLFISGYPDDVRLRHGAERTLPFLAKPFAPAQLLSCVAKVLPAAATGGPSR